MSSTEITWKREVAGTYIGTVGPHTYWVQDDPDVGGWTVRYPDGELSEPARSMREAKTWAQEDAAR